jgi:diguanylate cyclase (GGDEF)-like protein/PAS domain S-box-containing protein
MKNANYNKATTAIKKKRKKRFVQFFSGCLIICVCCLFLIAVPISVASLETAITNAEERIVVINQISFPLLIMSLAILLYSILRLLRYRKLIERKSEELKESEERYALAAQGANDGLWDLNLQTNEVFFSPRWKAMIGYEDNGIGKELNDWFIHVHPDDIGNLKNSVTAHLKEPNVHLESEYRIKHKDGTYLWMLCRGLAVKDSRGEVVRMAGSQTDITARKKMEEQLIYDAFHDGLTGLPNRALFMDRLQTCIARKKRRGDYQFAVLFMDLDRFKNVNDSYGHLFGNQMLAEVANRLNRNLRLGDTFARFGGDEFAILLDDIANPGYAQLVAERVHRELSDPFEINKQHLFISVSIGIAASEGYNRAEDIVRDADIAMYKAKFNGRGCHMVFDEAMRKDVLGYLQLETDLRNALNNNEFMIYYQPIVSLDTNIIVGFEALIRWYHEKRGHIPSLEFIPLAEETGMIIPLGKWVLQEACRQIRIWQEQFPSTPPLTVSINVSSKQLSNPDFVSEIKSVLGETGINPQSLKLEITESFLMEDEKIAMVLSKLKEMDVQIHIDDFGTGYSSLSYINKYPISALKIDRSFIERMGIEGEDSEIVRAIVNLAHNLSMDVIAEGVEKGEHLPILKALNCKYVQGYFFSQPLNTKEAESLLIAARSDAPKKGDSIIIESRMII